MGRRHGEGDHPAKGGARLRDHSPRGRLKGRGHFIELRRGGMGRRRGARRVKLPATASPTPPESLPHRHLLLLPHGPHQGTTTTRCGAFRVVVCMCVRARTVPSMSDAFVALVCVAVGVWRLSWALFVASVQSCVPWCVACCARRSCRRARLRDARFPMLELDGRCVRPSCRTMNYDEYEK